MGLVLRFAARSDLGLLRDGNEDSGYAGAQLLIVADGMGGHVAGEVASSLAVATVAELDDAPAQDDVVAQLADAVDRANEQLRELVTEDPTLRGMGTTLTALFYTAGRVGLAHVGDSRCYQLRDGVLQQITRDHTFVQSLIDEGRISAAQAETHPQRSLLTRALDGRDDVEPDLSLREVLAGDRFLLCSDGLSGVVREETLTTTLRDVVDRDAACATLIDLALRGGGPDNITCIVADILDEPVTPHEDRQYVGAAEKPESAPDAGAAAPAAGSLAETGRTDPRSRESSTISGAGRRTETPSSRSRTFGLLLGGAALLVVLALLLGGYLFTQRQYFVGADDAGTVAIYKGVDTSILGFDLSRLQESEDLPVSSLPSYSQEAVRGNLEAADLDHARRIVGNLRTVAADCAVVLTPTPTGASTAIASNAVPDTAAKPNATQTPRSRVTPTTEAVPLTGVVPPATPPGPSSSVPTTATPTPTRPPGCDGVAP